MIRRRSSLIYLLKDISKTKFIDLNFRSKLYRRTLLNLKWTTLVFISNSNIIAKRKVFCIKSTLILFNQYFITTPVVYLTNTFFLSTNPSILYLLKNLIFNFKLLLLNTPTLQFNEDFTVYSWNKKIFLKKNIIILNKFMVLMADFKYYNYFNFSFLSLVTLNYLINLTWFKTKTLVIKNVKDFVLRNLYVQIALLRLLTSQLLLVSPKKSFMYNLKI